MHVTGLIVNDSSVNIIQKWVVLKSWIKI